MAPFYAGPAHADVPGPLFALSGFAAEVAQHFFTVLAPRYDLRPRLPEITVPALVVTGPYDWVCPPVAGRTIAAGLADADYVQIPGAGHFPFAEEPAAFHGAVRAFLARVALRAGDVVPALTGRVSPPAPARARDRGRPRATAGPGRPSACAGVPPPRRDPLGGAGLLRRCGDPVGAAPRLGGLDQDLRLRVPAAQRQVVGEPGEALGQSGVVAERLAQPDGVAEQGRRSARGRPRDEAITARFL